MQSIETDEMKYTIILSFFLQLFYELFSKEIQSPLRSFSVNKIPQDIQYHGYLSILSLLLKSTAPTIDLLRKRADEEGAHFFLEQESTTHALIRALERDIAWLQTRNVSLRSNYPVQTEVAYFSYIDTLIAKEYPLICSYSVELSALPLLRKVERLSALFPEASHFALSMRQTKKTTAKKIFTELKKLSGKREFHSPFFITLDIFSLLYDILILKIHLHK